MRREIFPETITKFHASALEAVKACPGYSNDDKILSMHLKDPNGWQREYDALNGMDYRQLKRALKYGYTTHVKVKRIVITCGEGPSSECRIPHTTHSWEGADKILKRMALTAPKSGYDKTDFEILFTNGDEYHGTYELTQDDRYAASLYEHVTGHCEFYGGICKNLPNHIKSDEYLTIIGESTAKYLLLLDNVIYPSANQKGLDPKILETLSVPPTVSEPKRYLGTPEINLTLEKEKTEHGYTFIVYSNNSRYSSFKSSEALEKWMSKFGVSLGEKIRQYTYKEVYHLHGAFRVSMIADRGPYLHLPQIAILMNGGMVRAYKEVTPEVTNIYVVINYKESFSFDYSTPSGQWYLRKFFWNK